MNGVNGVEVIYGTDDDHGQFAGPWILLKVVSPEGDTQERIMRPPAARELADELRRAAKIVDDRAARKRGSS